MPLSWIGKNSQNALDRRQLLKVSTFAFARSRSSSISIADRPRQDQMDKRGIHHFQFSQHQQLVIQYIVLFTPVERCESEQ